MLDGTPLATPWPGVASYCIPAAERNGLVEHLVEMGLVEMGLVLPFKNYILMGMDFQIWAWMVLALAAHQRPA